MKTDPKNQERVQGRQAQPELTSPNTNHRVYKITVCRTEHCYRQVRVWARSEDRARSTAMKVASREMDNEWNVADRSLHVYSIETVDEGGKTNG